MNKIVEHWEKYPIPNDFSVRDDIKMMSTVEGVLSQLNKLQNGPGTVMVATTDESTMTSIRIQSLSVFKE